MTTYRPALGIHSTKTVLLVCLGLGTALLLGSSAESRGSTALGASEASQPAEIGGSTSGKVVETMNTAGYTYVLVDTGEKQVWFAAPGFTVAVGDRVVAPAGAEMRDHYSKTLDRTFGLIYFVGGIHVEGSPAEASSSAYRHSEASGAEPAAEFDLDNITKVDGGKTIAEIFDAGADGAGRKVAVRGRVVKFSPRILGTNFLHLRDGTSSADGRNDLTVTTQAEVEIGALVVVRGLVSASKDFGFGYTYDLMIEDASVTVE